MRYGFGVDLGGTTVKLAFFKETGEMLHKWEIPTDTSDSGSRILPEEVSDAILSRMARLSELEKAGCPSADEAAEVFGGVLA